MFVGVVSSALLRSIGVKVRIRMHAASRVTCVSTVPLLRSSHALPLVLTFAPAEAVAVAIDSEFVDGGTISPHAVQYQVRSAYASRLLRAGHTTICASTLQRLR